MSEHDSRTFWCSPATTRGNEAPDPSQVARAPPHGSPDADPRKLRSSCCPPPPCSGRPPLRAAPLPSVALRATREGVYGATFARSRANAAPRFTRSLRGGSRSCNGNGDCSNAAHAMPLPLRAVFAEADSRLCRPALLPAARRRDLIRPPSRPCIQAQLEPWQRRRRTPNSDLQQRPPSRC